ncbi:MAG TPA: MBL fold metallo-hydrolase [Ignavibacteriales bacterium]|nr:MBL fold metallo-hydrolase [Ignavibacteriales bacterium]
MIDVKVLGSSSSGNCYILTAEKEVLLLECGIHAKKIMHGLNFNVSNVAGCLITHEHKDHSLSARDLTRSGIDIYASQGTLQAIGLDGHRSHVIKAKEHFELGGFTILPFETQHDAAEPLGFLVYHPAFGKLLFATDTYYIQYKFQELKYIMVECNYSTEIADGNVAAGILNPALRRRLQRSHFSLENVKRFLQANDLSQVEKIMLMHLSSGNSDAVRFKNEIEKLTGIPTVVC